MEVAAHSAQPLLTAREVATRLGLVPKTVWRLARAGELPVIHPTGSSRMRFDPALIALVACGSWTPRSA